MDRKQTVLEGIIEDVATDLYNKWVSAMPESEKNEIAFRAMASNSHDTTVYIIQNFMNRFNEAAEQLQAIDDPEQV